MSAAVSSPVAPAWPPRPLTARQRHVLDYIRAFRMQHGRPPSVREIAAAIGIRSTNGVADHLQALKRKGFIEIDANKARGIIVLANPGVAPTGEIDRAPEAIDDVVTRENVALRELLRRALSALERVEANSLDIARVACDVRKALGGSL